MSFEESLSEKKEAPKCTECLTFYASQVYNGLCSSCHKSQGFPKKEELLDQQASNTSTPQNFIQKDIVQEMEQLSLQPLKKEQKDRKRCFGCNKKVGLLGVECKCKFVYCNAHRLPQSHECDYDHKERGKDKLRKQNVKVAGGKIAEI